MKRRVIRCIKLVFPLIFILIFAGCVWILLASPLFLIQNVVLAAHQDIFNDLSMLRKRRNLILANKQQLEQEFLKNPYIKSVRITKKLPNTLIVDVNERKPVAVWKVGETTKYVDSEGVVLDELSRFRQLTLTDMFCESQDTELNISHKGLTYGLRVITQVVPTIPIQTLSCLDENSSILKINGVEVVIDNQREVERVAASLLFLFKQFRIEGKQPNKVDMRFEKPVLIPEDREQVSTESAQ